MEAKVLRVHPYLRSVGRDRAGMVQGEMWRLGSGPRRVEGVCVQLQDVGLETQGTGASISLPTLFIHLGGCGLCTSEF